MSDETPKKLKRLTYAQPGITQTTLGERVEAARFRRAYRDARTGAWATEAWATDHQAQSVHETIARYRTLQPSVQTQLLHEIRALRAEIAELRKR